MCGQFHLIVISPLLSIMEERNFTFLMLPWSQQHYRAADRICEIEKVHFLLVRPNKPNMLSNHEDRLHMPRFPEVSGDKALSSHTSNHPVMSLSHFGHPILSADLTIIMDLYFAGSIKLHFRKD